MSSSELRLSHCSFVLFFLAVGRSRVWFQRGGVGHVDDGMQEGSTKTYLKGSRGKSQEK